MLSIEEAKSGIRETNQAKTILHLIDIPNSLLISFELLSPSGGYPL